jgi:hypothetical protein
VVGNRRTAYTEAGGGRHHPKDDPKHLWIDTYRAIKASAVNAIFVCHVRRPGDDPEFQLRIDGICARSYNADRLTDALSEWRAIAARATGKK